MPRRFVFQLPDGGTELRYTREIPTVGVTVTVLGREFMVVAIDEDRCTLEAVNGNGGATVPGDRSGSAASSRYL